MLQGGFIVALALALVACGPPDNPGRREQAERLAREFLAAVAGGRADRGWSLIHPDSREDWGDEDHWVDAAAATDWTGFEVSVLRARYCDDGVFCPVGLEIPGGDESIPDLLRSRDRSSGVVPLDELEGIDGNAEMWVVLADILRGHGGVSVPPPQ